MSYVSIYCVLLFLIIFMIKSFIKVITNFFCVIFERALVTFQLLSHVMIIVVFS